MSSLRNLIGFCTSCLIAVSALTTANGQANDKLLYLGIYGLKDVLQHSNINYGVGVSGRLQYPLAPKIALTARAGLEMYKITGSYIVPTTSLGYGYNPISGYGFNTIQNSFYTYPVNATGYNIPVMLGPRIYLTRQVHIDLNAGADIAASRTMLTAIRVEPEIGYTIPLGNGRMLDINTSYLTNFIRGSGLFSVGTAYGLLVAR